jgi:hypothetical protein
MPVEDLDARVSELEVSQWMVRRKPLWPRRIEMLLAQIAWVLARANGAKRAQLRDFDLFGKAPPGAGVEGDAGGLAMSSAQAFSAASGAGIRLLGQGRKRKG